MTTGAAPHGLSRAMPGLASRLRRPAFAASLAFAMAFAAAGALASVVAYQWQHAAHMRFMARTGQLDAMLRQELLASEAVLYGARSFLALEPRPDAARWADYVSGLCLRELRSPVTGVGVAWTDGDTAAPPVALFAPRNPLSERARLPDDDATRAALREARASGSAALAAVSGDKHAPLSLYLPFNAAPAAAQPPSGILFAPLDAARLFEPLLLAQPGITLAVRAGDPPFDLYASGAREEPVSWPLTAFTRASTIPFGGTTLAVTYGMDASPTLTGAAAVAGTILLAGGLAALAFAVLVLRLARQPASAAVSSGEARLNEARMMGIIRSSMEAIITIDETQTVIIFNPAAEFVFGVSAMEAVGSPLSRFIPERFRAAHAKHVEQFGITGVTERQMGREQRVLYGLRANGEEFPIEASISQIRDLSGRLYTVMLRDVTQRLRAENALKQSREELRELSANLQNVREAEKTRIARELHDDLGQQLTALKIDLAGLEHTLRNPSGEAPAHSQPQPTPEVAERVAGMRRLIDATVAAVRRIAADLRPVMLDDLGLVPAIEWLTTDFTQRYGIPVECRIDTSGTPFTSAAATALFRIVQEALTNVARHADATRVVLTLETDEACCRLRIVDDGRGAQPAASGGGPGDSGDKTGHAPHGRDKSFGLLGIRERAHMLGGAVAIDTEPGEGFALAVTFPLKSLQPEETPP